MELKRLTVRAPAKIILSGEHAVVYGNPALAMAVDRYTETTLANIPGQQQILFNLLNFQYYKKHSLSALRLLKNRIQKRYDQFLKGQYDIQNVLKEPFELLQYAVTYFIDKKKIHVSPGLEIYTKSDIPIGCGMGSSAAALVSIVLSFAHFSQLNIDLQTCYQLAKEGENIQHGYSSGVDIYLVLHGGCILFQHGGVKNSRPVPQRSFILVNTGSSASSTGECVLHTAQHLKNDNVLLAEFANATDQIDVALQQNNTTLLKDGIDLNHDLLVKIGVVPEKIQNFISDLKKLGAAAKICGAGAVRGENAGIVLIITDQDISHLVKKYAYNTMIVRGENLGAHVLS